MCGLLWWYLLYQNQTQTIFYLKYYLNVKTRITLLDGFCHFSGYPISQSMYCINYKVILHLLLYIAPFSVFLFAYIFYGESIRSKIPEAVSIGAKTPVGVSGVPSISDTPGGSFLNPPPLH